MSTWSLVSLSVIILPKCLKTMAILTWRRLFQILMMIWIFNDWLVLNSEMILLWLQRYRLWFQVSYKQTHVMAIPDDSMALYADKESVL